MRIAYVSPMPPQRSGIADYSAELLPHLGRRLEVDLYTAEESLTGRAPVGAREARAYAELPGAAAGYDAVLYHLGNDARFHGEIYRLLHDHPGVVVLHELVIHELVQAMTLMAGDVAGYVDVMRYCYGTSGERAARFSASSGIPVDSAAFPLFERVVDAANGVIVHNLTSLGRVKTSRPEARVGRVPHHLDLGDLPDPEALDPSVLRTSLGLPSDAPLVGTFGFLTPAKRLDVALRAFARARQSVPGAKMLLVGEPIKGYDLEELIPAEARRDVILTGRVGMSDFLRYLAAVDVVVNLRHPSRGETSGTLMRALGIGKAVVVTDAGAFAEIPDGCCVKVALGVHEEALLAASLERLLGDPELRDAMGSNARRVVSRRHTLEGSAGRYHAFLRRVARESAHRPRRPPVPPLAPWQRGDMLVELVKEVSSEATELGLGGDKELLRALAEDLVDLGLDRA